MEDIMSNTKYIIGESFCGIQKTEQDPEGDGIHCMGPYDIYETPDLVWHGVPDPEGITDYVVSHCFLDNSAVIPDNADEGISTLWGANATIKNTYIKNWGKGMLLGNGDAPESIDGNTVVTIENCVFDGNGRRNPYIQYATVHMKNCIIKNWGKTFFLKSHGVRVSTNAKLYMENCIFIMDKFVQTNFKNFFKDCCKQVLSPTGILNFFYPGAMRGVYTEFGGKILLMDNCYKNKWWISLAGKNKNPMSRTDACILYDAIMQSVPKSPEEAASYKSAYEAGNLKI